MSTQDIKISAIPAASTLANTDLFVVVKSPGSSPTTNTVTLSTLRSLIQTVITTSNTIVVGNNTVYSTVNSTSVNSGSYSINTSIFANTTGVYTPTVTANSVITKLSTVVASASVISLTNTSQQNILVTGSVSQTFVLPDATTLTPGWKFMFNNNAGSNGLQIYAKDGTTSIVYIQQGGYMVVELLTNGTTNGTWDSHSFIPTSLGWGSASLSLANTPIIGTGSITPQVNNALNIGSATLQYATVYSNNASISSNTGLTLGTASKAANGYSYLPNGLLMQWGTVLANTTVGNATFPIAFPSACQSVQMSVIGSANIAYHAATQNTTVAQIRTTSPTTTISVEYLAIGY
jgi:hypothetical protein